MNVERAKSIILIILIAISGYLTWSIWTFQPKYDPMQNQFINIDSDKLMVGDVIKPKHILIHRQGRHYQTSNPEDIEKAESHLPTWKLYNLKRVTKEMSKSEFNRFIQEDGTVEIRYPDDIPLNLYKSVLKISDKQIPTISFDRIFYKQQDIQSSQGIIYFVSTKKETILQASVEASKLKKFNDAFYLNAQSFPEFMSMEVKDHKHIYVPKNDIAISQYKYYLDYLDISNFKDALFSDPMNVRHESIGGSEEYTDGIRLLTINRNNYMLTYINPSQRTKQISSSSELLDKSIEFINNHAGWKESNYRYDSMDEINQSVIFRLYKDGYPVFNDIGMSEIEEIWGKDDIYSYHRPYFALNLPFDENVVRLPSGSEVLKRLKLLPNFDYMEVDDIAVGYKLSVAPLDSKLILLEPTWYYRAGGVWLTIPFEVPGGDSNGLE